MVFQEITKDKYDDIAKYVYLFTKVKDTNLRKQRWKAYRDKRYNGVNETKKYNSYWTKLISKLRSMDCTKSPDLLKEFEVTGPRQNRYIYFTVNNVRKRFIKASERQSIVQMVYENSQLGAYRGRDAMYHYIKNNFIGISRKFIVKVLHKYQLNQQNARDQVNQVLQNSARKQRGVLKKDIANEKIIACKPNDYWQADITYFNVNYPNNTLKKKLLVVMDYCTRFAWVKIIKTPPKYPDREYSEKREKLRELFCHEGQPRTLHGDNEFSSVRSLCDEFGVKLKLGTPYKSTDQGGVERLHQTLKKAVARWMWDNRYGGANQSWEHYIDYVVYGYNNTPHKDLNGHTPFDLQKPGSSNENVNRILNATSIRNQKTKGEDKKNEPVIILPEIPSRSYTIEVRPPEQKQADIVKVSRPKSKQPKSTLSLASQIQDAKTWADTFMSSSCIFPEGSIICYSHQDIVFHAKIEGTNNEQYTIQLIAIDEKGSQFLQESSGSFSIDVKTFHENVNKVLKITFFEDVLRSIEELENPRQESKKCKSYSATTKGSPYQDSKQGVIQYNVGISFDQNVIAETLFFIQKHILKKDWKNKGFTQDNLDEYLVECQERRKNNVFGNNENKEWKYTTDDFWKYLTDKRIFKFSKANRKPCESHNLFPLFFTHNVKDENLRGEYWTFQYQNNRPEEVKYDITKVQAVCMSKVSSKEDLANGRQVKYQNKETKDWERVLLGKRGILYDMLWTINEVIRNPELLKQKHLVEAVGNFLNVVLPKYNSREPSSSSNLPILPFVNRKYLYAYPVSRYAYHLFNFNQTKLNAKANEQQTTNRNQASRRNQNQNKIQTVAPRLNFLCWDTLLIFVYNIYHWIETLRSQEVYVAGYTQEFFAEVDKIKETRENRESKETSVTAENQIGRGYIHLDNEIQLRRKQQNAELYERRVEKRYREIQQVETRMKASKYNVQVGDIVRVKKTHIQEKGNKSPSLGHLYRIKKKEGQNIKDADPNLLDRYRLRLKWSETLYSVLAIGRVYQFQEIGGNETRHAFISDGEGKGRGDFRELQTIDAEQVGDHSTYIQSLLTGNNPDGIKFELNPHVNKLARLRYILLRITPGFYSQYNLIQNSNNKREIDLQYLKDRIEKFRRSNDKDQLNKFLPIVTHKKSERYFNNVRQKSDKQVKYFYRNNLHLIKHNVVPRKEILKPRRNQRRSSNRVTTDEKTPDPISTRLRPRSQRNYRE